MYQGRVGAVFMRGAEVRLIGWGRWLGGVTPLAVSALEACLEGERPVEGGRPLGGVRRSFLQAAWLQAPVWAAATAPVGGGSWREGAPYATLVGYPGISAWRRTGWMRWVERTGGQLAPCLSRGLRALLRVRGLIQEMHILAVDPVLGEGARPARVSTLAVSTSTLIAAALGYTRRFRRMFFIQQCLFKHLRRYLITLQPEDVEVEVRGVMPRFRASWRALTRANGEVYTHPLTGELLYDIGVSRRQLQGSLSVRAVFDVLWANLTHLEGLDEGVMEGERRRLFAQVGGALRQARLRACGWQRFLFQWARLMIHHTHHHGYVRTRRARSIKKRRSKRLVRQTQFRFWPR